MSDENHTHKIQSPTPAARKQKVKSLYRRTSAQSIPAGFSGMPEGAGTEDFRELERIQQVIKLRESEQKFRLLVEEVQDYAIIMLDVNGNVASWNIGAQRLKGYAIDEILGKNFKQLYRNEDRESGVPDAILEQAKKEGKFRGEGWRLRKDGSQFWASVVITALKDKNGNLIGFSKITRDMTERMQAEQSLRAAHNDLERRIDERTNELVRANTILKESEERFRTMADTAPVMMWMTGPDCKGSFFNKSWLDFTGRSMNQELGDAWTEGIHPEDYKGFSDLFSTSLNNQTPFKIEFRMRHHDGDYRWVLDNGVPRFDADGQFLGFIGSCIDINDRKKAEKELKRYSSDLQHSNNILAKANKELEQFAYVASHDLQEPLRKISNYSDLLKLSLSESMNPQSTNFMKQIVGGVERMDRVINDLLRFSRTTKEGSSSETVDVGHEIKRAIENIHDAATADITIDSMPTVIGNSLQIQQVFQNLISNAVKFHANIKPKIHIGVERRDHEWVFSVKDNGIGIERDYQERIFVIFQRLHSQQAYPGTGVGLAIVKKIVESHGGRVWVESEPGKGTTFFFSLPDRRGVVRAR